MTFVVTDNCIKCKYMDCVEVCPVDCFHEGVNMLVINPDDCIDCGMCVPECPAEAIMADTEPDLTDWLALNARYTALWPNVTLKRTRLKLVPRTQCRTCCPPEQWPYSLSIPYDTCFQRS